MSEKAVQDAGKYRVRLTVQRDSGKPMEVLSFDFKAGHSGDIKLDAQYQNFQRLLDEGANSLTLAIILKSLGVFGEDGYKRMMPIARMFHSRVEEA